MLQIFEVPQTNMNDPNKILNPATGKYVLKTGAIGKKLLASTSFKKNEPSKTKPTKPTIESITNNMINLNVNTTDKYEPNADATEPTIESITNNMINLSMGPSYEPTIESITNSNFVNHQQNHNHRQNQPMELDPTYSETINQLIQQMREKAEWSGSIFGHPYNSEEEYNRLKPTLRTTEKIINGILYTLVEHFPQNHCNFTKRPYYRELYSMYDYNSNLIRNKGLLENFLKVF